MAKRLAVETSRRYDGMTANRHSGTTAQEEVSTV